MTLCGWRDVKIQLLTAPCGRFRPFQTRHGTANSRARQILSLLSWVLTLVHKSSKIPAGFRGESQQAQCSVIRSLLWLQVIYKCPRSGLVLLICHKHRLLEIPEEQRCDLKDNGRALFVRGTQSNACIRKFSPSPNRYNAELKQRAVIVSNWFLTSCQTGQDRLMIRGVKRT